MGDLNKVTVCTFVRLSLIVAFSIFSVDNSEFMRNGDFLPSRLQAQQDAVNMVCHSKTRSNPESNVGLLTLAKYTCTSINIGKYTFLEFFFISKTFSFMFFSTKVLATLTTDSVRILSKLYHVQPEGTVNFLTGVRIAHVSLFIPK